MNEHRTSDRRSPDALAGRPVADIRSLADFTYRTGAGSRPDVLRIRSGSGHLVLKDYAGCDPAFRFWLGPLLCGREVRALKRLRGVVGVPRLAGRVGRCALLMEHIEAVPLPDAGGVEWGELLPRLRGLIDRLHAAGVAHCDLRSPKNILIDCEGNPWVVDFVASFRRGGRWNPLNQWLFDRFRELDRSAVQKYRQRYAGDATTDSGTGPGGENWLERRARGFGVAVRNLSRRLFTR